MPHLVLVGTASIQDYVFRSNRLRENLGASGLVRLASSWWNDPGEGRQQLQAVGGRLVYQGGGNAMVVFPDQPSAKASVRKWSDALIRRAPGLRTVVASLPYRDGQLADVCDEARRQLRAAENRPSLGLELGALPWTRTCPSTGWAATDRAARILDPDGDSVEDPEEEDDAQEPVWLSAEAQSKREHYWNKERARATQKYRSALQSFRFPRDLNLLGTTEGSSQIALIHADGNGIGEWIRRQEDRSSDRNFEVSLGEASAKLSKLANDVFRRLIETLKGSLQDQSMLEAAKIKLRRVRNKNAYYFPLRPIVDDGDDLTFVCHGRLGLGLAAMYLEHYERMAQERQLGLTACAGVLIMPQKFPFAQGYGLVEDLCARAKARARTERAGSWLDCHVQMEGRTISLDATRQRYPQQFPRRPWYVGGGDYEPRWNDFTEVWRTVNRWPRSEAKRLFEAFGYGAEKARAAYLRLGSKRQPILLDNWESRAFDPLELIDHYFPLEAEP
jgi:hypothetical protein